MRGSGFFCGSGFSRDPVMSPMRGSGFSRDSVMSPMRGSGFSRDSYSTRRLGGRVDNPYVADICPIDPGKLKQVNLQSLSIRYSLTMIPVAACYLLGRPTGRGHSPQVHTWARRRSDGAEINPAAVVGPYRIHIVAWVLRQVRFARPIDIRNDYL